MNGASAPVSIARRLAWMFALVALIMFTLTGAGLFYVLRAELERHLRESLDQQMEVARLIVYHGSTPERWRLARERLSDLTPPDGSVNFAVWADDPPGQASDASKASDTYRIGEPVQGQVLSQRPGGYARVRRSHCRFEMLTVTKIVPPHNERPALHLQVSESYGVMARTLRSFAIALAVLSALASLIVLWLSYMVTRLALKPLARLSHDAAEVQPDNRSQRLTIQRLPQELHELVYSFNGALERLDRSYGRLESFNADVAHELRTPLTILIGQTQVALTRDDRPVAELRHLLQSNLEEYERLRGLVNDMLFLARADRGELASGLEEVSLGAELAVTLEFLEMSFEDAQVQVVAGGDERAWVNRSLFGRACINLLINAMQHCVPGDTVRVAISRAGDHVKLEVSNPGAPIAAAAYPYLFDRFYRAEASRTNSRENHGLGLAIVKAIAEMHRGTVSVRCESGNNAFAFSVAATAA